MASVTSVMSEDQLQCSICLDVFTEPVSIPCGHNFCKACISRHWEDKQQCLCPLCNEKFSKGLKLCVNTAFRDVVENFNNNHQQTCRDNSHFLVKPGQVPCDCCLDNKFRASKTCLVCLTSYCETHLEPHRRVDALKRHTLTDPVLNLEEKICTKHNRILELYCRNDRTCVCVLCTDHSDHDTVPLERAFVNKKGHMGMKIEAKRRSGKKAQKTKAAVQTKRKDKVTPNVVESDQMPAPNIWGFPGESPPDFQRHSYVSGTRSFPQRGFCCDIQVKLRPCWHLGVRTESISGESTYTPIPLDGHWVIPLGSNDNKAQQNGPVHLYLVKAPDRVLVFLDHNIKLVSFHDPDSGALFYWIPSYNFSGSIFLFITSCNVQSASWAQRLLKKIQQAHSQLSPDSKFLVSCFIIIVLICFISYIFEFLVK